MPEVALKIGPKTYNVRCGEGEQEKIAALGALIAEKYALLGNARAPLEAQNLLFTSLFMADELAENRSEAARAKAELDKTLKTIAHDKTKNKGEKAELRAEIETLRKSEGRAREEVAKLKAELAALHEERQHQHDMFGGAPIDEASVATLREALADKAENAGDAMEHAVANAQVEDNAAKD